MDTKGRMGVRNWDFSGQHASSDPVLKHVSDVSVSQGAVSQHQATFLKMSAYQDRNSVMSEPKNEMPSMNFTWVPQRNFLSATKSSLGAMQSSQVNLETTNMSSIPSSADNTLNNGPFEGKPMKVGKKQPSAKKTKRVPAKGLRPNPNQPKKQSSAPKKKKSGSVSTGKREKRNLDVIADGVTFDFSGVPAPVCSCTGVPRQCYRWGAGGWQSSCCTTTISEYPLPMSTTRPGSRLAGRKMSNGAYGKLLQRLAMEGCDLSISVDLKNHWARHGTNKFVTIR